MRTSKHSSCPINWNLLTGINCSDGTEVEWTVAAYVYEDSPFMERVTKTVTAAGSSQEQTSVEETYGEATAYPYAAG